jgi:hypothetical protein
MPFTINDDATPPVFCRCALLNTNSSMASLVFVFSLLPFVKEYVLWCDELDEELSSVIGTQQNVNGISCVQCFAVKATN